MLQSALHLCPSCKPAHRQGLRLSALHRHSRIRAHLACGSRSIPSTAGVDSTSDGVSDARAPLSQPWQVVDYHTKKLRHKAGVSSDRDAADVSSIAEPPQFTHEVKMALAVKAVAAEMQLPEQHVAEQLALLAAVLPDLCSAGQSHMKPANVVRLAVAVDEVASKLILLRTAYPNTNVLNMVTSNPQLLQSSLRELEANIAQVKALLANSGAAPDALLEHMPLLLNPAALTEVLSELRRLFCSGSGGGDAVALLLRNPALALSCQSLVHQTRGDRDADYLRSIFSAEGP